MHGILINGNFLCRTLTGIERFAFETVAALDTMLGAESDVALFAPCNAAPPQYNHIRIIRSAKPLTSFPLWDMVTFARECARQGRAALSFSNTAPLGRLCGLSFIHDVYSADFPQDFKTLHEKAVAFYTGFHCSNICRNARQILTVSHFSAGRIAQHYHVDPGRITVVTNGWDHFKHITADESIFNRFPQLWFDGFDTRSLPQAARYSTTDTPLRGGTHQPQRGNYYFTLGSLQKRKNLRWVLECAKCHPRDTFVIAGGAVSGYVAGELGELSNTANIILTGRITDGQVKALMTGARAFLFPSLYEGFGIPPLEALSVGAAVVVSDIPVFHEIFGRAVHYVDPHDAHCDLDALLAEPTEGAEEVLTQHTYKEAAMVLLNVIKSFS